VAEVCMGIVVFAAWIVTPLLVLVVLPPAVLLQRSLTYVQMRAAARTDAKTGLLNAAAWQEEADREIVRSVRQQHPLAVLMIDLDHFKAFNDTYGHLAGDQALAAVASSLASTLRSYDQLGRSAVRSSPSCCPTPTTPRPSAWPNDSGAPSQISSSPASSSNRGSPSRSEPPSREPTALR